jgi:hypothetical protein
MTHETTTKTMPSPHSCIYPSYRPACQQPNGQNISRSPLETYNPYFSAPIGNTTPLHTHNANPTTSNASMLVTFAPSMIMLTKTDNNSQSKTQAKRELQATINSNGFQPLDTPPPDDNVSPYNASKAQNLANLDKYQCTFKTLQHDNPACCGT